MEQQSPTLSRQQQRQQRQMNQEGLSFGERQVGLKTNGGGEPRVEKIKQQFAEIIDQLDQYRNQLHPDRYPEESSEIKNAIFEVKRASLVATAAVKQISQLPQTQGQSQFQS